MSRPDDDRPGQQAPRPLPPHLHPRGRRAARDPRAGRDGAHPGRRRVVRGTRIVAAVVSFLVLTGSGYGWAAYRNFNSGVTHVDAIKHSGPDRDGSAENVLLVGDDHRPANMTKQQMQELSTTEDGGSVNTDTMMVLHIPADGQPPTVISFPRDSWVDIPGHGKGKLNSAFAYGAAHGGGDAAGMRLLIQTIQNISGLSIDHFVRVSLLGFYQIAQALGPIQVCLKEPAHDTFSGTDLPAGVSTLNAKQALSFVRQRHGLPRGDLDREVRQQYFLSAELRNVESAGVLLNPAKLNRLLTAVSSALQTDPDLDLLQFADQFRALSAGSVQFTTVPILGTPTIEDGNGNAVSVVALDFLALPAFITRIIGQPDSYTQASAADPQSVTVRIVNAGAGNSAGSIAGRALTALGFRVAGATTSPTETTMTTVTYPPGMEAQAKALAAKVPGATVAASSTVSQVTLTLGTDGVHVPTAASTTAPATGQGSAGQKTTAAPTSAAPSPAPAQSYSSSDCIY